MKNLKILIKTAYEIGQTVYFVTDEMQQEYIVTGFKVTALGVMYYVGHAADNETLCCDFEITDTKIIK